MKHNKLLVTALIVVLSFILYSCESNDFTVIPDIEPSSDLSLLQPPNSSVSQSLTPQFRWTSVAGAFFYQLQISGDNNFTSLVYDNDQITQTSFTLGSNILDDNSIYFWRVRGHNPGDTSEWSLTSTFATDVASPGPNGKVFVELFTNTSCIPCVPANSYLDDIFELQGVTNNDASVVITRIHTTLFPNDPFYEFNPEMNNVKQSYYGAASANPRAFLFGTSMGNFNAGVWTNLINAKFNTANNFALRIDNEYDTQTREGKFVVKVYQLAGSTIPNLRLFVTVVENELHYNAPNGETKFDNTLRLMYTDYNGDPLTLSEGQSYFNQFNYVLDSRIVDSHAQFVVYVQNYSTREIMAVEILDIN